MSEGRRCANPACGKLLVRHDKEQLAHWLKRLTCGFSCRSHMWAAERRVRELSELDPKTCVICEQLFQKRKGEAMARWDVRMTCSFSCKQTLVVRNRDAKRTDIPEKWCVTCGVQFTKRPREHIASFKARKTCSRECHKKIISRQKIAYNEFIRATPYPPEFTESLKDRIRERDGHVCRWCQSPETGRAHDVHHIDYDKANCAEWNLITLCRTCHVDTTFGDRGMWERNLSSLLLEQLAA